MSDALVPPDETRQPLVVRTSTVPKLEDYLQYKPYLRSDFFYSCAYCTMTEAEARAIRFTIDHYEPQWLRADLVNEYSNLMYACGECNLRKQDLAPPNEAREAGLRFFRPDKDIHSDHFQLIHRNEDWYLQGLTKIGDFTIDMVDLNRAAVLRLRKLRVELTACAAHAMSGLSALRSMPIDRLPKEIKAKAVAARQHSIDVLERIEDAIDRTLRELAKSELIDPDPDSKAKAKEKAEKLGVYKGLYPGSWRAPRQKKKSRRK